MFNISVKTAGRSTTLCLEGTLARERVKEARRAWEALSAREPGRSLKVDVRALCWFDADGIALLSEVHDSQAQIVCGVLLRQLLQKHSRVQSSNNILAGRIVARALGLLVLGLIILVQQRVVLQEFRASTVQIAQVAASPGSDGTKPVKRVLNLGGPAEAAASITEEILTTHEMDVLRSLAGGNSNRDIAQKLLMPEQTVQGHIEHIMVKLGAVDRTQAVVIGLRRGIL